MTCCYAFLCKLNNSEHTGSTDPLLQSSQSEKEKKAAWLKLFWIERGRSFLSLRNQTKTFHSTLQERETNCLIF